MFTEKATENDVRRLAGYEFKGVRIQEEVIEIAEMLIEDESGYELENQCDDAGHFSYVVGNELFLQRVCIILAVCRLLADEDKLRFAAKRFFVEPPQDDEVVDEVEEKEFVERMCDAAIHSSFLSDLVVYVRVMYLSRPAVTADDKARKTKHRMRVLRGFKVDSELCGRDTEDLAPPPPLKVLFEEHTDNSDNSDDSEVVLSKHTDELIEKYDHYDYTDGIEDEREKLLWGRVLNR